MWTWVDNVSVLQRVAFINIRQRAIFTFKYFIGSSAGVDVTHVKDMMWRYGNEVFHSRAFIALTFLEF